MSQLAGAVFVRTPARLGIEGRSLPGGNGAPNAPFPTGAGVGGMTPAAGAGFSVAGGEYAPLGAGEGMLRRPGGAIESFRGASGSWLG